MIVMAGSFESYGVLAQVGKPAQKVCIAPRNTGTMGYNGHSTSGWRSRNRHACGQYTRSRGRLMPASMRIAKKHYRVINGGVPVAACPPVIACVRWALAGKLPVAPRAGTAQEQWHTAVAQAGTIRYNEYSTSGGRSRNRRPCSQSIRSRGRLMQASHRIVKFRRSGPRPDVPSDEKVSGRGPDLLGCLASGCPVGTFDNSPAIHRWVPGPGPGFSPVGTAEPFALRDIRRLHFSRPYGTEGLVLALFPSDKDDFSRSGELTSRSARLPPTSVGGLGASGHDRQPASAGLPEGREARLKPAQQSNFLPVDHRLKSVANKAITVRSRCLHEKSCQSLGYSHKIPTGQCPRFAVKTDAATLRIRFVCKQNSSLKYEKEKQSCTDL